MNKYLIKSLASMFALLCSYLVFLAAMNRIDTLGMPVWESFFLKTGLTFLVFINTAVLLGVASKAYTLAHYNHRNGSIRKKACLIKSALKRSKLLTLIMLIPIATTLVIHVPDISLIIAGALFIVEVIFVAIWAKPLIHSISR